MSCLPGIAGRVFLDGVVERDLAYLVGRAHAVARVLRRVARVVGVARGVVVRRDDVKARPLRKSHRL